MNNKNKQINWSNYYYVGNIPIYAHKHSKIKEYSFLILHPNTVDYSLRQKGGIEIVNGDKIQYVQIDQKINKTLHDSIKSLSGLVKYTPFIPRFTAIYKSLENLTSSIPYDYQAIRNGIFHSSNVLSYPKTVKTLERIFGTKHINLESRRHRRLCYEYFARMLIDHDKLLYKTINCHITTHSS